MAVLGSPLAAVIPLAFFAVVEPIVFPDIHYGVAIWLIVAMYAVAISFFAVGTIGVAAYLIFRRWSMMSIWPYVLVGSVIAAIPGILILSSSVSGAATLYISFLEN